MAPPSDDALLADHGHLLAEPLPVVQARLRATRAHERPLTAIEIYGKPAGEVRALASALREVGLFAAPAADAREAAGRFSGVLAVSPFRTLVRAVAHFGFSDEVADLAGLLVGYAPAEVAEYLQRPHMRCRGLLAEGGAPAPRR